MDRRLPSELNILQRLLWASRRLQERACVVGGGNRKSDEKEGIQSKVRHWGDLTASNTDRSQRAGPTTLCPTLMHERKLCAIFSCTLKIRLLGFSGKRQRQQSQVSQSLAISTYNTKVCVEGSGDDGTGTDDLTIETASTCALGLDSC